VLALMLWQAGSDDRIKTVLLDYETAKKGMKPTWLNLYGAPIGKQR